MIFFTEPYFLQRAFFKYARLMTPMMPVRLTAKPISTITSRAPTLEVMPRLITLIKKPEQRHQNAQDHHLPFLLV